MVDLRPAQVGDIGEEVVRSYLESDENVVIVALGDSALPRDDGRQDLDAVIVRDGELVAVEVKTRYAARRAGTLRRDGSLPPPRLSRPRTALSPRQGDSDYLRARLEQFLDVGPDESAGFEVAQVDLRLVMLQFFRRAARRWVPVDRAQRVDAHLATALDVLVDSGRITERQRSELLAETAAHR